MKKKTLLFVITYCSVALLILGILANTSEEFKAAMAISVVLGYVMRGVTPNKVLDEEV